MSRASASDCRCGSTTNPGRASPNAARAPATAVAARAAVTVAPGPVAATVAPGARAVTTRTAVPRATVRMPAVGALTVPVRAAIAGRAGTAGAIMHR